jgi:hypothetical protein
MSSFLFTQAPQMSCWKLKLPAGVPDSMKDVGFQLKNRLTSVVTPLVFAGETFVIKDTILGSDTSALNEKASTLKLQTVLTVSSAFLGEKNNSPLFVRFSKQTDEQFRCLYHRLPML